MPPGGFGADGGPGGGRRPTAGNLHPDLAALLKRSLCPRDQRVADVVTWHKTLAKLMSDGQYNPTTFNLAFFMHNLFREEIERETQELESETHARRSSVPSPPPAAAPAPVAASPRGSAAAPADLRRLSRSRLAQGRHRRCCATATAWARRRAWPSRSR